MLFLVKNILKQQKNKIRDIALKRAYNPFSKIIIIEDIVTKERIEYKSLSYASKELEADKNTLNKYNGKVFRNKYLIKIIDRKI